MDSALFAFRDTRARQRARRWSLPVAAVAAFVLDGLLMSQGLVALLLLLVVGMWLLPRAWLMRRIGRDARRDFHHAALLLATAVAIMLTINLNNGLARQRAAALIAAVDTYREVTGRYPATLELLVPGYIAAIPPARWSLRFNRFSYLNADPAPQLAFVEVPPFARRYFDFGSRRWRSRACYIPSPGGTCP